MDPGGGEVGSGAAELDVAEKSERFCLTSSLTLLARKVECSPGGSKRIGTAPRGQVGLAEPHEEPRAMSGRRRFDRVRSMADGLVLSTVDSQGCAQRPAQSARPVGEI